MKYSIQIFTICFFSLVNFGKAQLPPPLPSNDVEIFSEDLFHTIISNGSFQLEHHITDSLIFNTKYFNLKMPILKQNVELKNTKYLIENENEKHKIRVTYLLRSVFDSPSSPFKEDRKLRKYLVPFLSGDLYGISEYFLSSREQKLVGNFHNSLSFKIAEKTETILRNFKVLEIRGENLTTHQIEKYVFFEVGDFYFIISIINIPEYSFKNNFYYSFANNEESLNNVLPRIYKYKNITYAFKLKYGSENKTQLETIVETYFGEDSLCYLRNSTSFGDKPKYYSHSKKFFMYDLRKNLISERKLSDNNFLENINHNYDEHNYKERTTYQAGNIKYTLFNKTIITDSSEIIYKSYKTNDSISKEIDVTENVLLKSPLGKIYEKITYRKLDGKREYLGSVKYDSLGRKRIEDFGFGTTYCIYNQENENINFKNQLTNIEYYNELGDMYLYKMYDRNRRLIVLQIIDNCNLSDLPQTIFSN
jgi:hypothetical protein